MSEHIDGTLSSQLEPALYERAPYLLPGEPEDLFAGDRRHRPSIPQASDGVQLGRDAPGLLAGLAC